MARKRMFRLLDYLYTGGQTVAAEAQLARNQQILDTINQAKEAGKPLTPEQIRALTLGKQPDQ